MRTAFLFGLVLTFNAACLDHFGASSSSVGFSGNGPGTSEGKVHCSNGVRFHVDSHVSAGAFTTKVTDPAGSDRSSDTFGPRTLNQTVNRDIKGPGGTWHMTATRTVDFEGSGDLKMNCL